MKSDDIDLYESFTMPYRLYRQIYLFMFGMGAFLYIIEELVLGGRAGFYMENLYYAPILGSGLWLFLKYIFYTPEELRTYKENRRHESQKRHDNV